MLSIHRQRSMVAGCPFVLQVLVLLLAAVGQQQLFCAAEGFTATLVHRDQYLERRGMSDSSISKSEKLQQMATRNMLRVEDLMNRRDLAATPAPGTSDWQANLTDINVSEYFIDIELGTPPQKFTVTADTGSDLTWVTCAPCTECSGVPNLYFPLKSSTFTPLSCSSSFCVFLNGTGGSICPVDLSAPAKVSTGCSYEYGYGDGSFTSGNIGTEVVTFPGATGSQNFSNFQFGCSSNSVDNTTVLNTTDGLVGLGRGNISFISQLGGVFGKQFGYCLPDRNNPNVVNVIEDKMIFGPDAAKATAAAGSPAQYTPLLTGNVSTFYYVGVDNIFLDGAYVGVLPSSLALDSEGNGGFLFDSGTTFTTLAKDAYDPLYAALVSKIRNHGVPDISGDSGFSPCYKAKYSDWVNDTTIPVISFQFHNTTGFNLTVDNAWLEVSTDQMCWSILENPGTMSIFGNVQQINFQIVYDLEKTQIGFAPTNCSFTTLGAFPPAETVNSAGWVANNAGTSFVTAVLSLMLLLVFTQ